MHLLSRLLFASTLCVPATSYASDPAPPSERRLSDADVEKVLEEAARKREAAEIVGPKPKLEVHGEVGVSVGTGGYRSAYGTANVALPGDGFISMSFDATHFGSRRPFGPVWR